MRKISGRLSYANVMATIAVFGALGGGAYAAAVSKNSVTSKSVKNNSLTGGDVKDNSITGADVNESSLNGATGAQGPQGPAGPAGSARAYGRVAEDGTVSRSKGVVGNASGSAGIYCLTLDSSIAAGTAVVVATPDFDQDATIESSPPDDAVQSFVEWDGSADDCSGNQVEVNTFIAFGDGNDDTDEANDQDGDVQFLDDAGFSFLVP